MEAVTGENLNEFHDAQTWDEDVDVFHDTEEEPEEEEDDEMSHLMERTPTVTSFESKVNELLSDTTHHQLVGKSSTFDTMAFAISIAEKFQNLEELQPKLVWKSEDVILHTLEETTQ